LDFFAALFWSASVRVTRWIDGVCGAIQGPRARWENDPGILSFEFFFSAFFDLKKWLLAIVFGSGGIAAIQFAPHKKEVLA